MKSKLLAVLALVIAASAFAVAAQAEPVNPALVPFGQTNAPPSCDELFGDYMTSVGLAVNEAADGEFEAAQGNIDNANTFKSNAKSQGCSWALTVNPPKLSPSLSAATGVKR